MPKVRDFSPSLVGSGGRRRALCGDSKLMVSWYVGSRDNYIAANSFAIWPRASHIASN
jgi:hypothetical protein